MKRHRGKAGKEPVWQAANRLRRNTLPPQLAGWLLDDSSLTRRLKQACDGRFAVRVLRQGWAVPMSCETAALKLPLRRRAMVREVLLLCDDVPWVFARTIIPKRTLGGSGGRLAFLGNRPLGEVLFRDPRAQRGRLEVSRVTPAVLEVESEEPWVWGRRSIFRLSGRPLLVSEYFIGELPPWQGDWSR
ncbi:chorismate--pyruvate lyase family protein [Thiohalomonas denitrificans]|uniref:chorismate--pyruvate lyase family protein n=1 Tax=Thiohalomonas denitrificans TaxID=415747 RepID=UPI0026EC41FE|nr:chorismate lyase [Thiohalomonas denitrificans]